ncbi:MAG: BTAD domain-containing putative transcriptional regulator [bacterium]
MGIGLAFSSIFVAHLRTFGRLELVRGESPAAQVLPMQPKRLALLAYLALASPRGAHRRDALLALFWPELNAEDGRRALRQALHGLRHQLGDGVLESTADDRIGIADGEFSCDAIMFDRAIEERRFADALALYHGDCLDGVFVSDVSPEFEQWVDATRARARTQAAVAASALADEARRTADRAAELRFAGEASRLAPDDEVRVRAWMRALHGAGDRAGAIREFQRFERRMAEEYDAEPAQETRALADELRVAPLPLEAPIAPVVASSAPMPPVIPAVETPGAMPRDPSAPLSGPDAGRAEHASPHRRRRILLGATLVLAFAAGLVARMTARSVTGVEGILVAQFDNHTRDSLLSGAVTEALRADLSQSRRTRVMSRSQVQAILVLMRHPPGELVSDATVREVAERSGVKAFVTGDVSSLGSGYSVSAELISAKGGEIMVSVRENAPDSTKLLEAVDRVSAQLRRGIGESLWTIHASPSLEHVTTSSLQALRLYSEAIRLGDQESDGHPAVALLQKAVILDTGFAMAYRKLGTYLSYFGDQAGADAALTKAFRLRSRLPELEGLHIAGSYYLGANLPDSAAATYRVLLSLYPNDMRALNNLADAYENMKEYTRAETLFHRAIETDSSVSLLFNHLATDQFNASRYDAAEQTLAARALKYPPQVDADIIGVSIMMMRGELKGARAKTEQLLASATPDLDGRLELLKIRATLSIIDGHLLESDRDQRAIQKMQVAAGLGGSYLTAAIALALTDIWYRREAAAGIALLDSSVARFPLAGLVPLDRNYAMLAYTYALGGRPLRARELLAELRANESLPFATPGGLSLRDEGGYLRALGATELAEGKPAAAVATLQRATELHFCPTCALPDLARALELTGAHDSAIVVYQRYVTTPWSEWQNAGGEYRVSAYRRLGALHDARGDTAIAIAAYDKVVDLWSTADPELQSAVADARQRAAALRGATRRVSVH